MIAVLIVLLVSLSGNCLVILSVWCNKAMRSAKNLEKVFIYCPKINLFRTTMNYYLVNLSIADLMITAWCPINSLIKELSDQNQYLLPAIFCKIGVFYTGGYSIVSSIWAMNSFFLLVLCMVSSVLTLSAISFDRFLAVICPLRTRVTQRKARWILYL